MLSFGIALACVLISVYIAYRWGIKKASPEISREARTKIDRLETERLKTEADLRAHELATTRPRPDVGTSVPLHPDPDKDGLN